MKTARKERYDSTARVLTRMRDIDPGGNARRAAMNDRCPAHLGWDLTDGACPRCNS